jgi:hypothetical protein
MSQTQALKSSVSLDLEAIVYSEISKRVATSIVIREHYLHRKPPINRAFAAKRPQRSLISGILGIVTFGTPMWSVSCGLVGEKKQDHKRPDAACHHVLELNRVCLSKHLPPNSESRFESWCLREMKLGAGACGLRLPSVELHLHGHERGLDGQDGGGVGSPLGEPGAIEGS